MVFQQWKSLSSFVASLLLLVGSACDQGDVTPTEPAKIADPLIVESSGIAVSRQFEGVLWTHNDDGPATVFALGLGGLAIRSYKLPVEHNDWEDISLDEQGFLYLLDNTSRDRERHTALVQIFKEPNPFEEGRVSEVRTLEVEFGEQGYDTETIFVWQGTIFLVTKPWDGTQPQVFSVDSSGGEKSAELVRRLPFSAMITGGDISPDGTRIALSSYRALFIFEGRGHPAEILATEPIVCPLNAGQVEGIAWKNNDLILTNEQGFIYRVWEAEWRSREAPFQEPPTARIPRYSPGTLEAELPTDWERGAWLWRPGEGRQRMGRVVWSERGLHTGILLPDQLRLSELPQEEQEDLDDWFRPGRVYVLINPQGDRSLSFGSNDRCVVVGSDLDGVASCQVKKLLPATVIQYSEPSPPWIEVETRGRWILVTLTADGPGLEDLEAGQQMGFNILVVGEKGQIISWVPLTLEFSWDAPSVWGLVELVD